jgi:hypothetical protein
MTRKEHRKYQRTDLENICTPFLLLFQSYHGSLHVSKLDGAVECHVGGDDTHWGNYKY